MPDHTEQDHRERRFERPRERRKARAPPWACTRRTTIAGLCLVLASALALTLAATASASKQIWEQCSESGSVTKYSEHQCVKAEGTGKWEWNEVKGTEAVVSHASLVFKDTKVPIIGTVEVQCTGHDEGSVGPGQFDRITKITEIKCAAGKNCEKIEKVLEPVHLPWQTELAEEEGKPRDKIKSGGSGAPGFTVACKEFGITETDECTSEEGSTASTNEVTNKELLVLTTFDAKTAKSTCKLGGAKAGELLGTNAILKANGWGLRVASGGGGGGGEEEATSTTLTTSLSGEGKEGGEITVLEGTKIKDKATLSGTNASKATGTVKYKVYSDKECKTLVTEAGEVTVTSGSVPASSEEELKGGASYYWQASYSGDSKNKSSTSACGAEIATVKAATALSTTLSGEGKEGTEIEVVEGAEIKDQAKLSGGSASKAGGTVKYDVYSDPECKELVTAAGEVTVTSGSVPASSEEKLSEGAYYWQAVYSGDTFNQGSTSVCDTEIAVVAPEVTTSLSGEGESGEELEVQETAAVKDTTTLHGEHASTATGTVKYAVYSDKECKTLVTKAGEVTVTSGSVPASSEEKLSPGTYYWQASYSGDEHNPAAKSVCGTEVDLVDTATSLSTSLSGESKSGAEIEVQETAAVKDAATLHGAHASTATGTIKYDVYSDPECKNLAAEAGDVEVTSGSIPESNEEMLPVGTYYWQAVYSGDGTNGSSTSACGSEISIVTAPVTTSLSGEEKSGEELEVQETAAVKDTATLHGEHASTATGTVKYDVYSDPECKDLVTAAGEVTVTSGSVPPSNEETLAAGDYYWQAHYSGDSKNPAASSACGTEVAIVKPADAQYAGLGDSFSSGEGTGTFYTKTNLPGATENKCHRSSTAYPARLATALYPGRLPSVTEEKEVLKQQPAFIFRACSGAAAQNLWGSGATGGQYNEWIEGPPAEWLTTPAQDLWLELPGGILPPEPPKPNNAITLVTMTVGGNDAGFGTVAENCIRGYNNYMRAKCKEVIKEWETGIPGMSGQGPTKGLQEGIPSLKTKLPVVLSDTHVSAPNARIRIPLYPQILNTAHNGNIGVGPFLSIENVVPRADSVAAAIEVFTDKLNQTISSTVQKWARKEKVNARVIAGTVRAFNGHRLGDPTPWANGVVLLSRRETFHPTCLGQIALAQQVVQNLGVTVKEKWGC